MRSRSLKTVTVLAVALVGAAYLWSTLSAPAEAQRRVQWKMASAFGSKGLPRHLRDRFADNVKVMSGGSLELKFFEPGALVPALECFDAVSKGSVESCWTTPGYHTGKYPALAFFTTVPFGPQLGEFLAWKWFGGGNDLRNEIYAKHNLFAFDCFAIGPETSGWFRKEVKNVAELKGIKMRFFGLGAQVMQKLGVQTQLLAGADIYPALERGVIDATEFSMPTMDVAYGFHQIAKNNYYPGWHQQVSVERAADEQGRVGQAVRAAQAHHPGRPQRCGGPHLRRDRGQEPAGDAGDEGQVQSQQPALVRRRPQGVREGLARGARGRERQGPAVQESGRQFPAWRKTYAIWGDAQELKNTYQK